MIVPCANCGKDFKTKNKGKVYCSPECRAASRKTFVATEKKKCAHCGKLFWPNYEKHKFCCKSCSSKARHKKWKKEKKKLDPFSPKELLWDGEPWSTIIIYGAFNNDIQDARRPDIVLGF